MHAAQADFVANLNSLRLMFPCKFWAMLKPAVEPPPVTVDSFDKFFAEVYHISLAPGEALVSSAMFDLIPTPDHLHIIEEDVQATLHREK